MGQSYPEKSPKNRTFRPRQIENICYTVKIQQTFEKVKEKLEHFFEFSSACGNSGAAHLKKTDEKGKKMFQKQIFSLQRLRFSPIRGIIPTC